MDAGEAGKIIRGPSLSPTDAAAVQDFWTPARIKQAENNPVPLPTPEQAEPSKETEPEGGEVTVDPEQPTEPGAPEPGGKPQQLSAGSGGGFQVQQLPEASAPFPTNGKLMVTFKGGQTGSCSGTLVQSDNQSLVVTAGHCIVDHQSNLGLGTKFVFIPGYKNGNAPFGEWPAQFHATFAEWQNSGNFNFDVAFLSLFRSPANVPLGALIGSRGISFNYPREQQWGLIGYPASPPYTGNTLLGCASSYTGSISTGPSGPPNMQAPCDFTPGSSGGGWLIGGTNGGAVGSVTSTKAPGNQPIIDGPYFGDSVLALYKQEQSRQTKAGAPSGACLRLKKAQAAVARAKKRAKTPAGKRALAKAKKALKAARKKAKGC